MIFLKVSTSKQTPYFWSIQELHVIFGEIIKFKKNCDIQNF